MDVRASDTDRDATVNRLREAAAEGRLTLEELTDRIEAAVNAVMRSESCRSPPTCRQPLVSASKRSPPRSVGRGRQALGAVDCAGRELVSHVVRPHQARPAPGADQRTTETHIHTRALCGNIDLLVPDGVEVEVQAHTQVSRTNLQASPGIAGAPRIVLAGETFSGGSPAT